MQADLLDVLTRLASASNIRCMRVTPPFDGLDQFDYGLRKALDPYFDWQEFGSLLLQSTPPNTLLFAEGTFELQFALFRIPDEENAVFMIGPWATAERSEKSRSWARRHIGEKGDDAVQSYYNGVRILSGSGFQASIVAVVSMMFPKEEFHLDQQKEFLPFHFTADLRYFTEPEFQREIPIQMLEQRYANENAIWDAAACGNTEAALKACQQMARFTYGGRFFGSLYQTKIMLTVMNTLLRKAIERSNIHPYYIDEISSRYALMIENMVDEESWPLVQTMVKEYCAYVRRYSLQQYSPLVQKVINTINLNLSDQLSPKSLAAMYYISPSYLSSLFKQDTGTTLTDFINTQRIQRAANLLSSTEQNISVVAEQVGILDVNYFTKMFKKSMGSTPHPVPPPEPRTVIPENKRTTKSPYRKAETGKSRFSGMGFAIGKGANRRLLYREEKLEQVKNEEKRKYNDKNQSSTSAQEAPGSARLAVSVGARWGKGEQS